MVPGNLRLGESGVDGEEAAALLAGIMETCSPEEAVAILYAQHWAESNANPNPEAIERLERAPTEQRRQRP